MTALQTILAAGLALLFLWLLVQLIRANAARRQAQAGYFAEAAIVLDGVVTRVEPSGWARVAGMYQGVRIDLQAVPDTLTFRKLPALWVMITVTEPIPDVGELHIMSRPTQTEVFSTFSAMSVSVALPTGFPEVCALRCDDALRLPPAEIVAAQGALFAKAEVKELVISPKGVRIVVLAEEAERGAYLLFRDAEMGRNAFAAARLLPHLAALVALRRDLLQVKERTDA